MAKERLPSTARATGKDQERIPLSLYCFQGSSWLFIWKLLSPESKDRPYYDPAFRCSKHFSTFFAFKCCLPCVDLDVTDFFSRDSHWEFSAYCSELDEARSPERTKKDNFLSLPLIAQMIGPQNRFPQFGHSPDSDFGKSDLRHGNRSFIANASYSGCSGCVIAATIMWVLPSVNIHVIDEMITLHFSFPTAGTLLIVSVAPTCDRSTCACSWTFICT